MSIKTSRLLILFLFIIMLSSCTPPEYKFDYVVEVEFEDGDIRTLRGTRFIRTRKPDHITFTVSSRLRLKPCLILIDEQVLGTNIACGVKTFETKSLTYKKQK